MTETTIKKDPFDFLFFYEFDSGEREEDALLVGDDPSTASPLHLAIGIKDAGKIVISPIPDVTRVSSSNYHFKLQFTPGILLQPEQITVEGDDWDLAVEENTILYLLWQKEEVILNDGNLLELMLNGVMATLAPAVRTSQTNVTLSWEFKRGRITVIDVSARAPGDTNPYNNTATEILEMIQRQGKANIPLYVGFFSSNRVLNTNNQESDLKLRITNTSESPITFNYDADATNRSQLVIALEVGDANTVPWALGTEDQVNDVGVTIPGDKWQKTSGPTQVKVGTTVKALEWTFSPKSADVPLAAKDTLVVELSKIVTAHPTGMANLYLRYKYVQGYQDGEFICSIEKAPLVFPEKNVGIGTSSPSKKFEVVSYGGSDQLVSFRGDHDLSLELRSTIPAEVYYELADGENGTDNSWKIGTNDDGRLNFGYGPVGSFNSTQEMRDQKMIQEKMTILTDGKVGIGTKSPEVQLHVTETVKAKKFEGDGVVVTKMILMWSGSVGDIPAGWKLCDGNNGTPNLKDKFIVAAGGKYSVGNTGGQDQVTLTVDQMPSHNHGVTDPGHTHKVTVPSKTGESDNADDRDVRVPGSSTITSASSKTDISINNTGGGKSFDNRPAYYALCFIMKVNI